MDKQLILDNIDRAIELVTSQPAHLFALDNFVKKEPCGTLFCTAGLIASQPEFREQGWCLRWEGSEWRPSLIPHVGGQDIRSTGSADASFGPKAWDNLFTAPDDSPFDRAFYAAAGIAVGWVGEPGENGIQDYVVLPVERHRELAVWRLCEQRKLVEAL